MIYDNSGNGLMTAMPIAYRTEYPFWSFGDRSCKLIYETMMVNEEGYEPLPLDTPCVRDRSAILVEETPPTIGDTGFVTYDRIYATLGNGFVTYGLSAYTLPGINSMTAGGAVSLSLTGVYFVTRGRYTTYKGWFVNTSAEAGDAITIFYDRSAKAFTDIFGGSTSIKAVNNLVTTTIVSDDGLGKYISGLPTIIKSFSGKINVRYFWSSSDFTINSVKKKLNRPVKSQSIPYKETFEFVYTQSPDDISITQPNNLINDPTTESFVDTLTDATEPTAEQYLSNIASNPWVQSDYSSFERWKGNIYMLRTPYVKVI